MHNLFVFLCCYATFLMAKPIFELCLPFFQNKQIPKIQVFNVVTQETVPVIEPTLLLSTSVARLKTIISLQVGLPISTFRLSTALGVELYDCNLLSDYDIELGTSIFLAALPLPMSSTC